MVFQNTKILKPYNVYMFLPAHFKKSRRYTANKVLVSVVDRDWKEGNTLEIILKSFWKFYFSPSSFFSASQLPSVYRKECRM